MTWSTVRRAMFGKTSEKLGQAKTKAKHASVRVKDHPPIGSAWFDLYIVDQYKYYQCK